MNRVVAPGGLAILLVACVALGCAAPDGTPATPPRPTPGLRAPAGDPTVMSSPLAVSALPTAVRLVHTRPEELVLRSADLPPGFAQTTEYPTFRLELTHPSWQPVEFGGGRGGPIGYYVVLVRAEAPEPDAVVSVASSVLRYETSGAAITASRTYLAAAPRTSLMTDQLREASATGDGRAWQYRKGLACVEEVMLRARNYLVALTVVQHHSGTGRGFSDRYVATLRAKLPE
jgi:hypothetical protein